MRRCVAVLAALVLVSGLSGCGRLLGQRYDNFTAYYNTFYNAKREFSREEEQLLRAERPVERDRYLTLFIEPEPQSGAGRSGGFAKAIEKGADLLRDHPESKWVDDALLLIGKAYFYQGNFSGAEQKFRETIELDENRLEDEARLWLGRTLTATERYEDAALALREGLDREGVREEWAAKMRLALAEVDVREGKFEEATASLREGLDGLRDDALAARASFLLGQVFETTGRPARAAEAYGRVLDYGPRYQLAYAAQLSRALTLGLGGEPDPALEELRRMRRDDKNLENFAEIELTRARVLAAAGRPAEARDLIRSLLYDPTPTTRIGNARGPAHYRLAEIYRDGLRDYVRAAAHYDTAATAIRQGVLLEERTTVQAITDAAARAESFGNYARVAAEIAEMDSLLYLGSLDDETFAETIEQIRVQREREARERERDLARRRSEQAFRGGAGGFGGDPDRGGVTDDAPAGGNGGTPPGATPGGNTGFLNFRNPVQVQEELIAFQARWGDRPLVPNWRRAAAISGAALAQEGGLADELFGALPQVQMPDAVGDNLVDLSGIPRDALSQQQMRADRAAARYELGNVLFLSLAEPDSASVLYRSVIDEDPDSPIAQRAYFALAEAQRALGNNAEAEERYAEVIEHYPDSRFADQARTELGLAPPEREVAADSVGLAAAAYDEAYERWQDGAYAEALSRMLALSDQYSTTPAAARARLAAGALYTEWAAGNEEVLFAPEPVVLASPGAVPGETAPARPVPAVTTPLLDLPMLPDVSAAAAVASVFTWVVASEPDSTAAAQIALDYRERGFDAGVAVAEVEGERTYRVRIGEFPGRAEALASRSTLPDDVPDAWLLALPGGAVAADAPASLPPAAPAADTTQAPAVLPTDLTFVPTDSTFIPADSTFIPADSTFIPADSVAAPAQDPWLAELYASIETDFPGTPFAERARLLRAALDVLRQPPPDSADVADPALEAGESIRGDAPIELRAGTFAWSVFASPERGAAELLLAYLAEDGYRTALYTERSTREATYHVIVGQFATQAAAEAVRAEIERIPDTTTYRLIPLLPTDELEQPE